MAIQFNVASIVSIGVLFSWLAIHNNSDCILHYFLNISEEKNSVQACSWKCVSFMRPKKIWINQALTISLCILFFLTQHICKRFYLRWNCSICPPPHLFIYTHRYWFEHTGLKYQMMWNCDGKIVSSELEEFTWSFETVKCYFRKKLFFIYKLWTLSLFVSSWSSHWSKCYT